MDNVQFDPELAFGEISMIEALDKTEVMFQKRGAKRKNSTFDDDDNDDTELLDEAGVEEECTLAEILVDVVDDVLADLTPPPQTSPSTQTSLQITPPPPSPPTSPDPTAGPSKWMRRDSEVSEANFKRRVTYTIDQKIEILKKLD